ncbi:MAG: hypothetical protein IAE95_04985 [Chitinophagaceae bacterium]|nr:hypothetical protein [Chitinophagaceae bacterium]
MKRNIRIASELIPALYLFFEFLPKLPVAEAQYGTGSQSYFCIMATVIGATVCAILALFEMLLYVLPKWSKS